MLRATLVYLFIGLFIIVMTPFGLLWMLVSGNSNCIYSLARFAVRTAGLMCGVKVEVHGRGKIMPGTTYVFLANHQGNFDAPVLLHAIPRNWKALIKMEMMRLPILSFLMKKLQFIPIERQNPQKARAGIYQGALLLEKGHSFLAFPEGTRSRDGRLGDFKKGVFVMAINAQAPIVPITIVNSSCIQPPGTYSIRPGIISVIFHDPISTQGMTLEDRNRLVQLTRNAIEAAL
jgi:1-acyl-sn-glycerol-3-phosphate acyltransferase